MNTGTHVWYTLLHIVILTVIHLSLCKGRYTLSNICTPHVLDSVQISLTYEYKYISKMYFMWHIYVQICQTIFDLWDKFTHTYLCIKSILDYYQYIKYSLLTYISDISFFDWWITNTYKDACNTMCWPLSRLILQPWWPDGLPIALLCGPNGA